MVKTPCAEVGDKRKHINVDLRTEEKLEEEGMRTVNNSVTLKLT
jgi:hypothetical protein